MRRPLERASPISPARLTLPGRGCGTENLASSSNWRSSGTAAGAWRELTVTAGPSSAAEPNAYSVALPAGAALYTHDKFPTHAGPHMSVPSVLAVDPCLLRRTSVSRGDTGNNHPPWVICPGARVIRWHDGLPRGRVPGDPQKGLAAWRGTEDDHVRTGVSGRKRSGSGLSGRGPTKAAPRGNLRCFRTIAKSVGVQSPTAGVVIAPAG